MIAMVQASRISTDLHRCSPLGQLPGEVTSCSLLHPLATFSPASCSHSAMMSANATAALVLLLLVIPGNTHLNIEHRSFPIFSGHLLFNLAIGLSQGFRMLSPLFLVLYLTAATLQVSH